MREWQMQARYVRSCGSASLTAPAAIASITIRSDWKGDHLEVFVLMTVYLSFRPIA